MNLKQLIAKSLFESETVEIGDGIKIEVFAMSGSAKDLWQHEHVTVDLDKAGQPVMIPKLGLNESAHLVAKCRPTLDGKPLLESDDDIELLGQLPSKDMDVLVEACRRLNGFNTDAIDEAAKNSDAAPSGSTASD